METSNLARSILILGVSMVFGALFNYFFFDKLPPGIGFTLFIVAGTAAFFAISYYIKKPVRGDLLWLFPILIFFAGMVSVRSSPLLTALNVLACLGLMLLIMEVSVKGSLRAFNPLDYLKVLIPFKAIDPFIQTLASALSMRKHMSDQKNYTQIVRGLVITIPILLIFGSLLASADPIFQKYASLLTIWNFSEEDIGRIIVFIIISVAGTAFFSYSFFGKADEVQTQKEQSRPFGQIETAILLGSVNILFLAFIVIQITYLFGGESNIISQGLTYADYARHGFFELVAVAALSYLILIIAERVIEKNADTHSPLFRVLSTALILQVGIIMVSAFYRMWLYEEAFGFTTLRVYVHAFIVLLAIVFVCLLYKIVVENKDSTFALRTFLAVAIFVVGMNFFNPDLFIAQKNLERFSATGKLDTGYLTQLSADATPVLHRAFDATSGEMHYELGHEFYSRLHPVKPSLWMQWNWSREKEKTLLMQDAAGFQEYASSTSVNSTVQANSAAI
jgi:hypothetical protein